MRIDDFPVLPLAAEMPDHAHAHDAQRDLREGERVQADKRERRGEEREAGEDAGDGEPRFGEGLRAEEERRRDKHREHDDAPQQAEGGVFRKPLALGERLEGREEKAFQPDEERRVQSPEKVRPVRAVPKPAEGKDDDDVDDLPRLALTAAAQRDVQVLGEPAVEADVPAAEKFGVAHRQIRPIEIFGQPHPHHARGARGDLRIPGEVAVHLDAEQPARHEYGEAVRLADARKDVVDIDAAEIGDDALAEKAAEQDAHTRRHVLPVQLMHRAQLRDEVARLFDGARHQLGEIGDEQRIVAEVLLRTEVPAVDVDDVGEGLEGVKGDADGQEDVQREAVDAHRKEIQKVDGALQEEIEIFEKDEDAEADDERRRQPELFDPLALRALDEERRRVGYARRPRDEKDEPCVPAHVEVIARREQPDPARLLRQQPIHDEHDGKIDEKVQGIEVHPRLPLPVR